ncbi:hypothetical protein [Rhizobium rosettiformans]|uniref:hypothetical protein n=1 Tax=Rhizobium rosettiformans TaxID=1368430 RepID=UPI00285E53E5|nr:hypothetical protein [Rhizobium rosettiformans]MDR7029818.1 hypothetical protein [Rhizobium rosettiformans]MDR7063532.1 hypothetical protein [Rhizobium rosettiformans]
MPLETNQVPAPHTFADIISLPGVADLIFEGEDDGNRLDRLNVALRVAVEDMQAVIAAYRAAGPDRAYHLDWAAFDALHSLASLGAEVLLSGLDLINSTPPTANAAPTETAARDSETISAASETE